MAIVHDVIPPFQLFQPSSLDEALDLLDARGTEAWVMAGGMDSFDWLKDRTKRTSAVVELSQVGELHGIRESDGGFEIGAMTTLTDVAEHAGIRDRFGMLAEAAGLVASPQIRNQGTLGGNIGNASPIGDAPPLLIALGAEIVLRKGNQTRTLPLDEYFLDYKVTARQESEFIEKVRVPRARKNQVFRAYKVSKRLDDDISAVCAAFNLVIEDGVVRRARVAFGGMAGIPKRASACEQALVGSAWYPGTVERACEALAQDFSPLTDFRASKEYRLLAAQNLLRKCFLEQQSPAVETRVTAYV